MARKLSTEAVYAEYLEAKREYLAAAETYGLRGWPDRQPSLRAAFRFQGLFLEREAIRFEDLMKRNVLEGDSWRSLSAISARLLSGWSASEEDDLMKRSPAYSRIATEASGSLLPEHSEALLEPLEAVQRDSDYVNAREAFVRKIRELDALLKRQA